MNQMRFSDKILHSSFCNLSMIVSFIIKKMAIKLNNGLLENIFTVIKQDINIKVNVLIRCYKIS